MTAMETETRSGDDRALAVLNVRFGLWALLSYLTLGLGLEVLHGFKVGWYLDFETRRLMWTLGHAHGVLLAILVTIFGGLLWLWHAPEQAWRRKASACLMAATILLPGGFLLGGAFVYGGDPGIAVLLSPVGGVALVIGVGLAASNLRPPGDGDSQDRGAPP